MAPRTRAGLLVLTFLILDSASFAQECGAVEDSERASYRALTWADFQAPPPPAEREGRTDRTAVRLYTSIRIDAAPIAVSSEAGGGWRARLAGACVRAYALKQLSGRRPSAHQDRLLAHEQGHFDLTELYTLRLATRLRELSATGATPEEAERELGTAIRIVYATESAAHERAQARYDGATAHGQNRRWQAKWDRRIAESLRLR